MIGTRAVAFLLALGACGEGDAERFDRLAQQVAPIATTLGPKVALFVSTPSTQAALRACFSADQELKQLREIDFDEVQPPSRRRSIAELAEDLLDDRHVRCRPADMGDGTSCANWCFRAWSELIEELRRFQDDARRRDVELDLGPLKKR